MAPPRPNRSRPWGGFLSTLLALACLAGCSGAEPPVHSRLSRPALRLAATTEPVPAPQVVRAYSFTPLTGQLHSGEAAPGLREGPEGTEIVVWKRGGRLRLLGLEPVGRFERVVVRCRARGVHNLTLSFDEDDQTHGTAIAFAGPEEAEQPKLETLTLELPQLRFRARPVDEVELKVDGPDCEVESVELIEVPLAATLPSPDAPGLIGIEGDYRLGVGLAPGQPIEARHAVEPGDVLHFAYALPAAVASGGAGELVLRLESGAHTLEQIFELHELPVEQRSWTVVRVPLEGFGAAEVHLELELRGGKACAIADLWIGRIGRRPATVVLITSDTHRGDSLGCAGSGVDVRTPGIDGLASRGVLFEDCYSSTNITSPSHTTLLTGLTPRESGIQTNFSQHLSGSAVTLSEDFAAAGYLCFSVVSAQHLGPEGAGLGQGFDRQAVFQGDPAEAELTKLLGWMDEAQGQDLFVWLHLLDAHYPYAPPEPYSLEYYPADKDPFDPALPEPSIDTSGFHADLQGLRDLTYPVALYRGEISYVDAQLGRLFARPRMADAVVAFTADHGEVLARSESAFGHFMLLPDTLHVPLILSWPGAPAGRRVGTPVEHQDLGRTLLDLAGLQQSPFPGHSLLSTLEPQERAPGPRFALAGDGIQASVAAGPWFLSLFLLPTHHRGMDYQRHQVVLFDVGADPQCLTNVKDQHPDITRQLRAMLVEWLNAGQGTGFAESDQVSVAQMQSLRALGYTASPPPSGSDWIDPGCDCEFCAPYR